MARTRYATDRGLIARMGVTMFLLGLVFTAFIIALIFVFTAYQSHRAGNGYGSGSASGGIIVFAALIGIGSAFASYYWSDKIALRTSGARLV